MRTATSRLVGKLRARKRATLLMLVIVMCGGMMAGT